MTKQWIVLKEDKEFGPLTSAELKQWSTSGQLNKSDLVKKQGMDKWVKATKVRGLAFGSISDGERLTTAYLALTKKTSEVFTNDSIDPDRKSQVISVLSKYCFDESLIKQLQSNDVDSGEYMQCALGHDFLYWSTLAVLADGKVEKDELVSIGPLVQQIAQSFSNRFDAYAQFKDLPESKYEAFLATFKKDKSHYEWKKLSLVTQDVLVGSQVAIAASIFSPLSECLESYVNIVESIVSTIIMIDGETPEEQALFARCRRLHKKMKHQLSQASQLKEQLSPLLQEDSPQTSSDSAIFEEAFAFRKISWGTPRDEVLRCETTAPIHETDDALWFPGSIVKLDAWIIYAFVSDLCVRSKYVIKEEHVSPNGYLTDYGSLRDLLIRKYGRPESQSAGDDSFASEMCWRNDLYQDDPNEWGFAVSIGHLALMDQWKTAETEISLVLMGDNYEVNLCVEYSSVELSHLEEEKDVQQHLDDL